VVEKERKLTGRDGCGARESEERGDGEIKGWEGREVNGR
jgi:hypothetical protein